MKKLGITTLLLILALIQCRHEVERRTNENIFSTFNEKARKSFQGQLGNLDLYPMSEQEKCMLNISIQNYLDEMNSRVLTQYDSFFIRSYDFEDLGSTFSFVEIRNKFYFIYLPRLYEFLYSNKYYKDNGPMQLLLRPEYSIARINSETFDNFVEQEISSSGKDKVTLEKAMGLLTYLFPHFTRNEATASEFEEWLNAQPLENQEVIKSFVNPILLRQPKFSKARDHIFYKVRHVGYFLLDWKLDDDVSQNMEVDIFFMPLNERYSMRLYEEKFDYSSCHDQP